MTSLEMLDLPWFNIEEKIQRLREARILLYIFHLKPTHLPCKGPEDTPFTIIVRNKFMRRAPTSLKCSVFTLSDRLDLIVKTAVIELGNLNTVGVIGSWGGRRQLTVLYHQRQDGSGYQNRQQSQSSNQNSLDWGSQVHWLVDCGVP